MNKLSGENSVSEYIHRVNKTIDFIKLNLDANLSLDELAGISNFSKFHFHRIFRAVTGMTPNVFMVNARLERAAFKLINNPTSSISDIAFESGFESASSFSRSFKKKFEISPSVLRLNSKENSKIGIADSNISQWSAESGGYLATMFKNSKIASMEKKGSHQVEVVNLENLPVIYVRNLDVHIHDVPTFGRMFESIFNWAAPRGLINFPETKALTVYRSMPSEEGTVQADVCLTVPEELEGEGIIGRTTISGGLYAVIHKESSLAECFSIWEYMYQDWFPSSGFQPDSRNFYINHLNDAKTHPQGLHIFDMCIPIKPL